MDNIGNSKKSVVDNDTFIDLMRIAQESDDVRERLKVILQLDSFNRKSILNTWLRDLNLQGAPKRFITTLSAFLDDGVAERAMQIMLDSEE